MINKIRFEKWNNEIISSTEEKIIISRLPKWINQFITELNDKNITLVIFIDQYDRLHYHFESLDGDLFLRMQMASER